MQRIESDTWQQQSYSSICVGGCNYWFLTYQEVVFQGWAGSLALLKIFTGKQRGSIDVVSDQCGDTVLTDCKTCIFFVVSVAFPIMVSEVEQIIIRHLYGWELRNNELKVQDKIKDRLSRNLWGPPTSRLNKENVYMQPHLFSVKFVTTSTNTS